MTFRIFSSFSVDSSVYLRISHARLYRDMTKISRYIAYRDIKNVSRYYIAAALVPLLSYKNLKGGVMGFWRYARFKNMPFFLGAEGGGRYIWYSTVIIHV